MDLIDFRAHVYAGGLIGLIAEDLADVGAPDVVVLEERPARPRGAVYCHAADPDFEDLRKGRVRLRWPEELPEQAPITRKVDRKRIVKRKAPKPEKIMVARRPRRKPVQVETDWSKWADRDPSTHEEREQHFRAEQAELNN